MGISTIQQKWKLTLIKTSYLPFCNGYFVMPSSQSDLTAGMIREDGTRSQIWTSKARTQKLPSIKPGRSHKIWYLRYFLELSDYRWICLYTQG